MIMEEKLLPFDKNVSRYRRLADERSEKEDFLGALRFLRSARSIDPNDLGVIMDIADAYADAGLLELSNRYWFLYLDSAPKDKVTVAYEELAINYFYMDNFWASSFYFHKKLEIDGFIAKEGLSQEIIDFFSGEELKKGVYKIVYPYDRADYSYEFKKAKQSMSVGAFDEAIKILSNIPKVCLDEDAFGDLAVCHYMNDELDLAEENCRDSLKIHGENVTAYCNLSTICDMSDDFDNSEFYYQRALSCRKGEKSEVYKIATCAIEREDHKTALECLNEILKDRPYELAMRFFYSQALANLGRFDEAYKEMQTAYAIDPDDKTVRFYLDYMKELAKSGKDTQDLLPFKYVKDLPEKIIDEWKKKVKVLVKKPAKIAKAVKNDEWQEILSWGLFSSDSEFMRDCAYVLSMSLTPFSQKIMFSALLDPEAREELKRVIIYVLIVNGVKEKFGVVGGCYYAKIKPRKTVCEKDVVFGGLYFSSYALCLSKMVFFDVDNLDKIGKECDRIYKKIGQIVTPAEATNEEIAGLILSECNFEKYSEERNVLRLFSITKDKLHTLKKILKGEQDD